MKRTLLGTILALILVAAGMMPVASASADTTETKTMQIPSTQPWTDTGLIVSPGDTISITASGNVYYAHAGDPNYLVGPEGLIGYRHPCECCYVVTSTEVTSHALVGNIAQTMTYDGKGFLVGPSFSGPVPVTNSTATSGKLFLGFNDTGIRCDRTGLDSGTWGDNSGAFTVTITISRPSSSSIPAVSIWSAIGAVVILGAMAMLVLRRRPAQSL